MYTGNLITFLLVIFAIFELHNVAFGDEAQELETPKLVVKDLDKLCEHADGYYYRGYGCCNATYIENRAELLAFGKEFRNCLQEISQSPDNKDDDLPTLIWKSYLCILKSKAAFPEGELTFQAYVNYLTENYGTVVQGDVRRANSECLKANEETEDWKKVMKFAECFYENEKKVCHHPTAKYDEKHKNVTAFYSAMNITFTTSFSNESTCTLLEGSYNTRENCCKNTPIPISVTSLLTGGLVNLRMMHGHNSKNLSAGHQCSNSFKTRQIQLYNEQIEALNVTNLHIKYLIHNCSHACLFSPMIYGGPESLHLNRTALEMDYYMKSLLPETFHGKVSNILNRYRTNSTIIINSKKLLTLDQFMDDFENTKNEMTKISYYCFYYQLMVVYMKKSFREYCMNEE